MASIATVVIPTFQRAEMLRICLRATARACEAVPPGSVDVVVSDDSRDQITLQLLQQEFPWVHYVQGPRRGPASNRNCGAATANSPWLVFMDDDCIPDPQWLMAYLVAMGAARSATLFEGRTYADRDRRSYAEESPVNETGGCLWSCNMAISTALFRRLGGFCESFPYPALEDVELRLRLQAAGHQPIFVPTASVCHPFRPRRGWQYVRQHNESYRHLLKLHPELAQSMSWAGIALNTARMLKSVAVDAWRYGLPGTGRVIYSTFSKAWIDMAYRLRRPQSSS